MPETLFVTFGLVALLAALAAVVFLMRAQNWGATAAERALALPGDAWLAEDRPRVAMTRAVTIGASTATVWPWLAQAGRGAGWYSYDLLDNARKTSAQHIVSWVPAPAIGDAAAIGYLRHLVPGAEMTWWLGGIDFLGSTARSVMDIRLTAEAGGSRVVVRISADATGVVGRAALWLFYCVDGIMARRQLVGLRARVERHAARRENPEQPETGNRDQYQHFEVIYRSGERAGSAGSKLAARWRRAAIAAGVVDEHAGAGNATL